MIRVLISTAAVALGLTACSASDIPLVGPCAASKRVGPDRTYYQLALHMVSERLGGTDKYPLRSEQDRSDRLAKIARESEMLLPTISDGCLRAHAVDWIAFYRGKVSRMEVGAPDLSDYDRRQAEEADQRRALAEKLGVRQ